MSNTKMGIEIREHMHKAPTTLNKAIEQMKRCVGVSRVEIVGLFKDGHFEYTNTANGQDELIKKIALLGGKSIPIFNNSVQISSEISYNSELDNSTNTIITLIGREQVALQITTVKGETMPAILLEDVSDYCDLIGKKKVLEETELFYLFVDGEGQKVSKSDYYKFFKALEKQEFPEEDVEKLISDINLSLIQRYDNEINQNIMYFVENERMYIETVFAKKVLKEDEKKFTSALFRILGERHASFGLPNYTKYQISGNPEFEGIVIGEKVAYAVRENDESIMFATIDLKGNRTDYEQFKHQQS
jgi:hypothetical protein